MGAAVQHDPGLAGRAEEQELLARALEGAASGTPCALVVEGEAGVGKTCLVRDACGQSRRGPRHGADRHPHDLQVLWGTCVNFGASSVPFAPIIGALRTSAEDGIAQLAQALGGAHPTEPGQLLPRIDDAFNRLAQRAPTVLVIDDLQWADRTSLDVLAYLIAGFRNQRLALLMTCRDEHRGEGHPLHGWFADMRRMPSFEEIHLDRLTAAGTEEQLETILGRTVDDGFAAEVYGRSDGNPYLTELLVRSHDAAPTALRDALLATWHGLSPGARQVTRVLAVGGRPIELDVLAAVASDCDIDPGQVPAYLVEAADEGVVRNDGDGRVWFRHPLLAEVLYDALPHGDAVRIHAAFVGVLEPHGDDAAADLAVHNHRAGRADEAYRWSLVAADRAAELHASTVASLHLERACSLWDQLSPNVRGSRHNHIDLLHRTWDMCEAAGRYTVGIEYARQAMELVDRGSEPLLASHLLLASHDYAHPQSAGRKAVNDQLLEALRLTDGSPDSAERAFALEALAFAEGWDALSDASAGRSGLNHVEEAIRVARRSGNEVALAAAFATRALLYLNTGTGDPLPAAEEAERAGRRSGDPLRVGVAVTWRVRALGNEGRFTEAAEVALRAADELHALGASWEHFVGQQAADWLFVVGRWRECREVLRRGLAARCDGIIGAAVRLCSSQLALHSGRLTEARLHLDRALEMASEDYAGLRSEFSFMTAELLAAEGEAERAFDWLVSREAEMVGADNQQEPLGIAHAAAAAACAARDAGDLAGADRVVGVLDDLVERLPRAPFSTAHIDPLSRARHQAVFEAQVARAHDDEGQAALWRLAADRCQESGMPWHEARSRVRAAEAMIVDGSPRSAVRDELRRAHMIAADLGAAPLVSELEGLARVARIDLREPVVEVADAPERSDALSGLTSREREVLAHLVAGRSNREIGKALFISGKTVSVHVSSILRKTGTASRTEAAVLAERLAGRERT
ncbi:AAA family ATPase [Kribbella sp. NPDC050124]|uniref:helix-turn-helix transcriptional regulator n=1 Tax=Kribbella sp. NPDC050124 TaxID=3364114 RepID=UPI00379F7C8F